MEVDECYLGGPRRKTHRLRFLIHIDGWKGYNGIAAKGYLHQVTWMKAKKEASFAIIAPRPQSHLATEAVAQGNPSGSGEPQTPTL